MAKFRGFTKTQLLEFYRTMVTARYLDDKMMILIKQGQGFFHIGCSGHEAAQVAAASCFSPGQDWALPYYRDGAFTLQWGMSPREHLQSFLFREADRMSGGRQMPQHYSSLDLRIPTQSSPTGTQYLQAVGIALGNKLADKSDIVYTSSGEGTTSQGDFHEALNWASRAQLGVIFHIQDNEYAISTHVSEQTAGASAYKISAGYEALERFDVNGSDIFEVHGAFKKAVARARKGDGPSIIVSHVPRLLPHSSSDDQRKYRSADDLDADRQRDPIAVFGGLLCEEKITSAKDLELIVSQVRKIIDAEVDKILDEEQADGSTARLYVYDEHPVINGEPSLEPASVGEEVMLVDAINHALNEELESNSQLLIYGQDVAGGKGGVFTATRGLTSAHGKERVFNSPLAESSIVGTAIGLALSGFKPVVEIQFGDYIWTAIMQIKNELANIRYRSKNQWSAPVVLRVPVGGYIHGGPYHSQSVDGFFTHMPGLKVAYPSNSADAKGLLKMACRMSDPVLFLEHKGLYRQRYAAFPEPDSDFLLEFGHARITQPGADATIITWGAMVKKSLDATRHVGEATGKTIEVIDLRTLNPLDWDTIFASVKKTNRVLIVHEDVLTGGFGAEIGALLAENAFENLDAPVKRIGAYDSSAIPFGPALEERILPQTEWIETALTDLLDY